jgi:hypothetical protein
MLTGGFVYADERFDTSIPRQGIHSNPVSIGSVKWIPAFAGMTGIREANLREPSGSAIYEAVAL